MLQRGLDYAAATVIICAVGAALLVLAAEILSFSSPAADTAAVWAPRSCSIRYAGAYPPGPAAGPAAPARDHTRADRGSRGTGPGPLPMLLLTA